MPFYFAPVKYFPAVLESAKAYFGVLWRTLAYFTSWSVLYVLERTLAYFGVLWRTLAYFGVLWRTLRAGAYFGVLWRTLAYFGVLYVLERTLRAEGC
jgi:hypothetical protein